MLSTKMKKNKNKRKETKIKENTEKSGDK